VTSTPVRSPAHEVDGELSPSWRPHEPRRVRAAVVADTSDEVAALAGWVAGSSYELVLAVQLLPADAGAEQDGVVTVPARAHDAPLLLTRTPSRTVAPLLRGLVADVLVSGARQALPAHVAHAPRTGTLELRRSSPGGEGSAWVLSSPAHRVLASSTATAPGSGDGSRGGAAEDLAHVLRAGLERWFAVEAAGA
jgi:hypothetical protein